MTAKKDPAAVALGRRGGKVKSEAKAGAARANGAKGGRPSMAALRAELEQVKAERDALLRWKQRAVITLEPWQVEEIDLELDIPHRF